MLRLASWNIENLVPWLKDREGLPRIADHLGRPDILCLQEVRVRPGDAELIATMREALPGYECHASLCRDSRNVTYRGGRAYGTATYVRSGLAPGAAETPAWDREGRVLVTRLPAMRLAVVNVYAVNGTAKPYYDHDLGRIDGDRHVFKRRVQDLLFALAGDLAAAGSVIMAGDWNVSRSALDTHPRLRTEEPHARARAELNRHIDDRGLVDAFRQLHPDEPGYTWFHRRQPDRLDAARVDYILMSASLLPGLMEAHVAAAPPGPPSDHRPVVATVTC